MLAKVVNDSRRFNETLKVALRSGSSMHGKADLASVAWNCVAANQLKVSTRVDHVTTLINLSSSTV